MTARRTALRSYLLAVSHDLIRRGEVRARRGDSLDDVLREEGGVVLASVAEDIKAVAQDMGIALMGTGAQMLGMGAHRLVDDALGKGLQYVMEQVAGAGRKR